jgi:hypothetical protein
MLSWVVTLEHHPWSGYTLDGGFSSLSVFSSLDTVFPSSLPPSNSFLFHLFRSLPFSVAVTPLFATLTKTTGVYINSSQNGTFRLLSERN